MMSLIEHNIYVSEYGSVAFMGASATRLIKCISWLKE